MAFEIDLLPVGSEKKSGDCIAMRYGDLVSGKDKQTVIIVDGISPLQRKVLTH